MIMKKMLLFLCAGALILGLTACGRDAGKDGASESTEQTDSQDNSEDNSAESQQAADSDTSLDYGEGWSEEMESLKTAVVEALGDEAYWPNMAMLPDMLEMTFGLTPDMYEDYMAETPMISANVDTLLIVRAKDDKVEAVEDVLEAYRDVQINDTMQYPMNVGKVQASRIETIGNYVLFVQLGGDTGEAAEESDEAVIAMCQTVNDSVIETIRARLEEGADN